MEAVWRNNKQTQAQGHLRRAARSGGRSGPGGPRLGRRAGDVQWRPAAAGRSIAVARCTRILAVRHSRGPGRASRSHGAQRWSHIARCLGLGFRRLRSGRHLWRARV